MPKCERCRTVLRLDAFYLMNLKSEAKRRRVWFKVLSRLDRGLIDLTIKLVNKPRSSTLIMAIARIVVRIKMALMSPIRRLMEMIGEPLAKKISSIALSWGNKMAGEWVKDKAFVRYLTIVDMNDTPGFRLSETLTSS